MRPSADDRVRAYRYLCRRGALKFLRAGLERNDLEQVAAIGLIKASRRYDSATGTPFEAYAWSAVVGELMHFVRDHEHCVRIPRGLQALERRYTRARETLSHALGRDPRDGDVAAGLEIAPAVAAELQRARAVTSTAPLSDAMKVCSETSSGFEDRALLALTVESLAELERRVLLGLYIVGLTQMELSRRLGVPRKTIARAHRSALASMQRSWVA